MAWFFTCQVDLCSGFATEVVPEASFSDALKALEKKHNGSWTPIAWQELTLKEAKKIAKSLNLNVHEWADK